MNLIIPQKSPAEQVAQLAEQLGISETVPEGMVPDDVRWGQLHIHGSGSNEKSFRIEGIVDGVQYEVVVERKGRNPRALATFSELVPREHGVFSEPVSDSARFLGAEEIRSLLPQIETYADDIAESGSRPFPDFQQGLLLAFQRAAGDAPKNVLQRIVGY